MIITRTPYRISFFGGGTDYPAYYREHGGAVLATTIDKFVWVTCRYLPPFFQHDIRVVYSRIEETVGIDSIVHPSVREALRLMKVGGNVEIHYDGDLPSRSGMGSSSSFTVGLLHALHGLRGQMPDKRELANQAIEVEQSMCAENVGCQDQLMAAHGGFNKINFLPNGDFRVSALTLPTSTLAALNSHLLLFHTKTSRFASHVAKNVIENIPKRRAHLARMYSMVDEGQRCLAAGPSRILDFGHLLHEAWSLKRELADGVTNDEIDTIYAAARDEGALGGKILGAGAGGFLLLFAPPELHSAVIKRLSNLVHVPFSFESEGTSVIYYDAGRSQDFRTANSLADHNDNAFV